MKHVPLKTQSKHKLSPKQSGLISTIYNRSAGRRTAKPVQRILSNFRHEKIIDGG